MLLIGCPHGSVLCPTLWIVLFDSFLKLQFPDCCETFTYADDGLLVVTANSRTELENKAMLALDKIQNWSQEKRLTTSPE